MNKENKSTRLIDLVVAVIIVGALALAILALKTPPTPTGDPVIMTITVTRNANLIYPTASKLGKAYFSSTENPVEVTKVTQTTRNNLQAIKIEIRSNGKIENNQIIFNGVRVLIGQKAEIHGNFFAQGVISDVQYQK